MLLDVDQLDDTSPQIFEPAPSDWAALRELFPDDQADDDEPVPDWIDDEPAEDDPIDWSELDRDSAGRHGRWLEHRHEAVGRYLINPELARWLAYGDPHERP